MHTLNAVRELDRIYTEAEADHPQIPRGAPPDLRRLLLHLTLLLHDIGKAEAFADHAESGVRLATPLLERNGVGPAERDLILFVIQNHLAMARFWQTRDVG